MLTTHDFPVQQESLFCEGAIRLLKPLLLLLYIYSTFYHPPPLYTLSSEQRYNLPKKYEKDKIVITVKDYFNRLINNNVRNSNCLCLSFFLPCIHVEVLWDGRKLINWIMGISISGVQLIIIFGIFQADEFWQWTKFLLYISFQTQNWPQTRLSFYIDINSFHHLIFTTEMQLYSLSETFQLHLWMLEYIYYMYVPKYIFWSHHKTQKLTQCMSKSISHFLVCKQKI